MESTSKRGTKSSVRYTYSDEDDESEKPVVKKKKKVEGGKTSVCKICHKRYKDSRHMEIHRETLDYRCDICDAQFKTNRYLARHKTRVHATPTHECEFCGKRFTMPSKLDQHRLVHTGEKPHKCEVCGKTFRAIYSLKTHRLLHTNEKPYKCQYCTYACRDSSTLRKHHERHTGTLKWHHCSYCDKKFYAKCMLKNHVSERHFAVDLKVIPCPKCPSKFKTSGKLNYHIKTVHDKAYRAECEVCGVVISNKNNMASHLRAHIDVRPYRCPDKSCKRRFKDMSSLKKHTLIHNEADQFSCGVCGELFARRHRLNVHTRRRHGDDTSTNTKLKMMYCDHCGFGYDSRQRLVRHMLKHVRHRRTYACDVCKFVTHRRLSIERHVRYGHGDEDDVLCKICNKNFKLHAYLIPHYYNRHGIRYKTIKSMKMETSVTIKEEPQELIPDAEVDLEEIQKQEPLANIITDVALDRDATDLSYSKSVLNEDIRRSTSCGLYATSPHRFRRRLRGRAAMIDEQNTLYAKKEKEVRKRIRKLLSKVRLRKWTRILERARRQYNERIRAMSANKNKENNSKIKYISVNQVNNNDIDKNNKNAENNSETKDDKIISDQFNNETSIDYDSADEISLNNDIEMNDDVRNIYEDVFDIEENPVGNNVTNSLSDESKNDKFNAKDSNGITTEIKVNTKENLTILANGFTENDEINLNHNAVNINNENDGIVENVLNGTENCESNEEAGQNVDKKDVVDDKRVKKAEMGDKGKNLKLKINTHQCYICYKLYETKQKLLQHCAVHFDICSDTPLKKCPICNYVTELTITKHLKDAHGISITLPYHKLNDKNKNSNDASRYCYNVNDEIIKEIEIIPSVRNLNKIAYINIDKNNKIKKDMSVAKTKLVKKSGEWVVEHENLNVNDEFILPEFDKGEIKKLKSVGDQYLDVIKTLGRLATRHKAKMLYPCNNCDKFCRTFAALKLHSRRHETNPKPFKKKVWKHKLKGKEVKINKSVNNRNKKAIEIVRRAKPRPIENKHKCDKQLIEFYENNVQGAGIEFWQFLKIYNRMNKDHAGKLKDLKETNEFGDYTTEELSVNDISKEEKATSNVAIQITNTKINNIKPKSNIRRKFSRKLILSKEERLRHAQIKEQLRRKNLMTNS